MKEENINKEDIHLKQLFGEALGDMPSCGDTDKAWKEFNRKKNINKSKNIVIALLSAAACIALFVVFQSNLFSNDNTSVRVFVAQESPSRIEKLVKGDLVTISTPSATIAKIMLPDSSEVILGANSRLEYKKSFIGSERNVRLSGEARFSVTKDASHPFVVTTPQITTLVLGTEFDVKSYNDNPSSVILYRGSVRVSTADNTMVSEIVPGEQVVMEKSKQMLCSKADTENVAKWVSYQFAFDNVSLKTVLQEIGAWYNISISAQSASLLEDRIYFKLSRRSSIDGLIESLNDLGIARFSFNGSGIMVMQK